MPNTLTIVFTSIPSTEPVEFQNPNGPSIYTTGTQQANGTWQAIFTGVTKGTYGALTARLKNFPAISATIAANNPVLNIQQAAPTPAGTSATGSGPNSISVTGNSSINATAYRFLFASAQAGPYSLLVTQAAATYNHTGLTAGATVWYEMQYVGGGFYDDSPPSLPFSGATVSSTAFAPLQADYGQNLLYPALDPAGTGYSTAALLTYSTNAPSLVVNITTEVQDGTSNGVGVFLNGTYLQYLTGTAGTADYSVDLSSVAGSKAVTLVASAQIRQAVDTGRRLGAIINNVTYNGGTASAKVAPVKNANLLVMTTDSIWQGYTLAVPARDGETVQLRGLLAAAAYDVVNYGWSGASLNHAFSTSTQQNAAAASINAQAAGYTGKKVFYLALATNDYWAQGISAATASGYALALASALYALDSTWRIIIQGPLGRFDNTGANPAGSTLQNYTDAFVALNSGRAWLQTINAQDWLYQTQTSDNVHPNAVGAPIVAGKVRDIILANAAIAAGTIATTFDGTTYVSVQSSEGFNPVGAAAFAHWIFGGEVLVNGVGQPQQIFAKAFSGTNNQGLFACYYQGGVINFGVFTPAGVFQSVSINVGTPAVGQIFNIGASTGTANGRLLVVNAATVSGAAVAHGTTNDPIVFGGARDGTSQTTVNRLRGTLDHVSIFNTEQTMQTLLNICAGNCILSTAIYTDPSCAVYSLLQHAATETRMENLAVPTWVLNIVPVTN